MTVSTTSAKELYQGNGSTTTFPYNFIIKQNEDLTVIKRLADDTEVTLVLGTDYTVSGAGNPNGGNVECPISGSPLTNDERISIIRRVSEIQETDYQEQSRFSANEVERSLDYLTFQTQQLGEDLKRCPKVTETSDQTGDDLINEIIGYKEDAQASADDAQTSATNAQTSATNAQQSADDAEDSRNEAQAIVDSLDLLPREQAIPQSALADKRVSLVNKEMLNSQRNPVVKNGEITYIDNLAITATTHTYQSKICNDDMYIYSIDGEVGKEVKCYRPKNDGSLELISSYSITGANAIYTDRRGVYVGAVDGKNFIIYSFSVTKTGILELIDNITTYSYYLDYIYNIVSDGDYLLVGWRTTVVGRASLTVYKINNSLDLAYEKTYPDYGGGIFNNGQYLFIFENSPSYYNRIKTEKLETNGDVTLISEINLTGDEFLSLWSDGYYLYSLQYHDATTTYLRCFSMVNDGTLILKQTLTITSGNCIYGDGRYIYVAGGNGVYSFYRDDSGVVAQINNNTSGTIKAQSIICYNNRIYIEGENAIEWYLINNSYSYNVISDKHSFLNKIDVPELEVTNLIIGDCGSATDFYADDLKGHTVLAHNIRAITTGIDVPVKNFAGDTIATFQDSRRFFSTYLGENIQSWGATGSGVDLDFEIPGNGIIIIHCTAGGNTKYDHRLYFEGRDFNSASLSSGLIAQSNNMYSVAFQSNVSSDRNIFRLTTSSSVDSVKVYYIRTE